MKSIISVLLLFCLATAGFSQRVPSSCTAPDSIVNLYKEDAARMAFKYLVKRDSSYIDSINISQKLEDTMLSALLAVYNSGLFNAKAVTGRINFYEPVIELNGGGFFIHDNFYSLRKISLVVDTTISWEKNLYKYKTATGNIRVDSFMLALKIKVDTTMANIGYANLLLETDTFQNTLQIATQWNEITGGVTNAKPNNYTYWAYDGGSIVPTIYDSSIVLEYQAAWGDCPSGCIYHHSWTFTIYPDCSVEAGPSVGVDLGAGVKNANEKNASNLTLHPNPSSEKITIEIAPQSKIELIDVTATILKQIQSNSDQEEIDVSKLPNGIYLIKATDKKGNIGTAKFVKE